MMTQEMPKIPLQDLSDDQLKNIVLQLDKPWVSVPTAALLLNTTSEMIHNAINTNSFDARVRRVYNLREIDSHDLMNLLDDKTKDLIAPFIESELIHTTESQDYSSIPTPTKRSRKGRKSKGRTRSRLRGKIIRDLADALGISGATVRGVVYPSPHQAGVSLSTQVIVWKYVMNNVLGYEEIFNKVPQNVLDAIEHADEYVEESTPDTENVTNEQQDDEPEVDENNLTSDDFHQRTKQYIASLFPHAVQEVDQAIELYASLLWQMYGES